MTTRERRIAYRQIYNHPYVCSTGGMWYFRGRVETLDNSMGKLSDEIGRKIAKKRAIILDGIVAYHPSQKNNPAATVEHIAHYVS
jgi:hypothetical protein